MRKRNEVAEAVNGSFNDTIGAVKRRMGYEQVGQTIQYGNDGLYGGVFNYYQNHKVIVGINNGVGTNATLKYFNTGGYWTDIITDAPVNTRFQCTTYLDELYVAGRSDAESYLTLQNVDSTLTPSTSRNVYGAPKTRYIAEYGGRLYAINVEINGTKYKDRVYQSSPALGAITFIQTAQSGLLKQLRVDSTKYLKTGMQIDIYGKGTEAKKVSALTIVSVDKKNNRIGFEATSINVEDNDEVWLTGRKGKLSIFWNVDHPTPEDADYLRIPAGVNTSPEFTGWAKNNNRLFLYTKNSFMKWDGGNLVTVSDTVGCVSHESIQNIGSWTLWLHTTGVWGYNDNTGELKLLSRGVQDVIHRINQSNLSKVSAGVVGRVYKLAVGELVDDIVETTSTSTSSTSTSSTSTSTSSTSTSSTSTSSTSTSTSRTTTSTSSTSSSTSSTSVSTTTDTTTSTSFSTSSTSTSTTTATTPREIIRLCYDFDMNAWWQELHIREIRFQFNHYMHGYVKPYFIDDLGYLFRDETGNTDNGISIPERIRFGRNNLGIPQSKVFHSILVDSEAARGALIQYSVDGSQFKQLGQITQDVQSFEFPQSDDLIVGRDIDYQIIHNDTGDPPIINGITTYFNLDETFVNELGVKY
jgi:hypothetical protein